MVLLMISMLELCTVCSVHSWAGEEGWGGGGGLPNIKAMERVHRRNEERSVDRGVEREMFEEVEQRGERGLISCKIGTTMYFIVSR